MERKNVISIIPYQRLGKKYGKLLGNACRNYVLEGEIKKLFDLREKRIISAEELKELCRDSVGRRVNGGISGNYATELESLIGKHEETQKRRLTTHGEEEEDLAFLGARYGQPLPDYVIH
ncbi:MAG TPA: hypothetical protein VJG31_02490 [Candidatus Nanoarchaeia archaeon]|nr:hypothetical protein [Candidatus Nanoarchaeia archaeon]